jgi:hypothetical protein
MKKRLGKFYINKSMIDEKDTPDILARMAFVPYRVELLAYRNDFEFIGTSKLFDEHTIGYDVPEYQIVISTARDKSGKAKLIGVRPELIKK